MGERALTKRDWILYSGTVIVTSTIAVFLYRVLSILLTNNSYHAIITLTIVSLSGLFIFLLIFLRFRQARSFWLKLWICGSPLFLSSVYFLPMLPFLLIPILWLSLMLFSLWGYYGRFALVFDSRLHRARFARADELADMYSSTPHTTSLLLGENLFRKFYLVRSTSVRRELGNLLVVAPTRGGKGLLAVSQLLSWKHSVIVQDIKGELFSATSGYRASIGKVFVIDPTGVGHRYDPLLSKKSEDKLYSAATRLLFKPQERDPIFTKRAISMLTQLFLAARIENIPPLLYARGITRLGLPDAAKRLYTLSPELARQFLSASFEQVDFTTNRFLLSSWESLVADMEPLLTETVVRCFAGCDFTSEQLMRSDTPITVYLRWSERDLLAHTPLVRLLWGSLIDELITTYDSAEGRGCKPVLLLIDEAGRAPIPSLADHATTVVGRGISLCIYIQSLEQLTAEYGHAGAQVLRDNMESQIYYRPSELETAKYLSDRSGRKSAYAHSQTLKEGAETAQGLSEQGIPLLTPQEILQMKDEQIIGFHRRLPPFKMRRVDWRHHPKFIQKRQIPPPKLSALPRLSDIAFNTQQFYDDSYVDSDMILAHTSQENIRRLSN
jgi:type IV secretory pathway TraG/TraD family ATPase VirD4